MWRRVARSHTSGMTLRPIAALVAALPAAVLVACSATPAPAAPAAPTKDTGAACNAEVAINAAIPPGADPDSPAPSAAAMQSWAASVATPFATLQANAPDTLRDSVAVLGGVLAEAQRGQRIDVTDPKTAAASNAVDAWVHDNCGFQTLDLTSSGGKLGPVPAELEPGPVSIKFTASGEPRAFVVLLARVNDGQRATAADVDAGKADFEKVAQVVGAAQPTGAGPAYSTSTVTAGRYLLTTPLGAPPNFTGTASLDLTVS
jgi:hypothetical protein